LPGPAPRPPPPCPGEPRGAPGDLGELDEGAHPGLVELHHRAGRRQPDTRTVSAHLHRLAGEGAHQQRAGHRRGLGAPAVGVDSVHLVAQRLLPVDHERPFLGSVHASDDELDLDAVGVTPAQLRVDGGRAALGDHDRLADRGEVAEGHRHRRVAGRGGDAVTAFAAENYPILVTTDFSAMATPALVVAGEKDDSAFLTVAGPSWHADPYHLAPGPKALLTLYGAEHGLGGVSGYDVAETTDEDPDRVATVARLTTAYLRSQLYPGDPAWQHARDALAADPDAPGHIESK
jgi:hypothetical protein